ncbi:MAG: septation protein IspZ [Pseudomonadales bacterium]|nr:septation protein IspZ [Pseudomonadales bacterium]
MKQFTEFLPIAIFAGVYFYTKDIFISTGVLMAAMTLQVLYEFITTKTVAKQTRFIFASIIILGALTLIFRDEVFIKWKPTLVNWAFCVALIVSQLMAKENPLKKMLGEQLPLPDNAWKNLTIGWSLGFFIAGALNLVVAYNFSMDFWVSYKLIGGFAITLIYIIITMIYLVKGGYLQEPESNPQSTKVE